MIIPPLFWYFLPFSYPYILLHFICFLLLVYVYDRPVGKQCSPLTNAIRSILCKVPNIRSFFHGAVKNQDTLFSQGLVYFVQITGTCMKLLNHSCRSMTLQYWIIFITVLLYQLLVHIKTRQQNRKPQKNMSTVTKAPRWKNVCWSSTMVIIRPWSHRT